MPQATDSNLAKLETRLSREKGKCVYTLAPVAAGSLILEFKGPLKRSDEIPFEDTTHCLEIAKGWYMTSSGGFDDYVNHSCTPNCGLRFEGDLNAPVVTLAALEDIAAQTELTFDYSTYLSGRFDPFPCSCLSAECRGAVGAFKELPQHLRDRYLAAEVVAPYLRSYV